MTFSVSEEIFNNGTMRCTCNKCPDICENEERSDALLVRIPAGRYGEPEDLKGAVVLLSSAAGDFIHGTILPVDGGWLGR